MMIHRILSFLIFFLLVHCSLFNVRCSMALAQSRLYIRGSAVPGGIQQLTKFPTNVSGRNTFKYHGKLLPGNLYITTTSSATPSTYYAPKLVDTNIVTNKADYVQRRDSVGAEWAVLFEADNYRFTVDTYHKQLTGELFTRWYEAWICGGCVEDEQGKGTSGQEGHWQLSAGKQMVQDRNDPNVFEWVGLLKNYTYNQEPKRFKINGQYGWSPKVLHPFGQDASILTAKQVWYNGSEDYKWAISKDGYYRIRINVFEETIEGEYLGADKPDGISTMQEAEADISVSAREIAFQAETPMTVRLFSIDGTQCAAASGTSLTLTAPAAGIYILTATGAQQGSTWKILVK